MKLSIKLHTIKARWSFVHIDGSQVIIFKKYCSSLKIHFVLANSADHNIPLNEAFYLILHCLPKYPFWGFWSTKGKMLSLVLYIYYSSQFYLIIIIGSTFMVLWGNDPIKILFLTLCKNKILKHVYLHMLFFTGLKSAYQKKFSYI